MRRFATSVRCAAALLAAGVVLSAASPAGAASPGETLGVFSGPGDPAAVADFERRVGRPVARVHDFFGRESWAKIESVGWWTWVWGGSAYAGRMVFTVPMLPDTGGTLSAGAAGLYDEHFRVMARNLVAGGQGAAVLRVGHEFNGNWYRWSIAALNGAANYAAYWRRIVTAMRSVPGAAFRFDWSPISGGSWVDGKLLNPEAAYPGDAYVDYVGLDVYDQSWSANRADPAARWAEYLDQPYGLRWHRSFAAAHGKPMTFPEWGVAYRTDGYGGGDSPEFVSRMHEWISANDVAYHLYFDYADGIIESRIFDGLFPNAAERFAALFGPGTTTAPVQEPTAPTPTPTAPTVTEPTTTTPTTTTPTTTTPTTTTPTKTKRRKGARASTASVRTTRPAARSRTCLRGRQVGVDRRRLVRHPLRPESRGRATARRVAKPAARCRVANKRAKRGR